MGHKRPSKASLSIFSDYFLEIVEANETYGDGAVNERCGQFVQPRTNTTEGVESLRFLIVELNVRELTVSDSSNGY